MVWPKGRPCPQETRDKISQSLKDYCRIPFEPVPSSALAYVLGVMYGDGNLYRRRFKHKSPNASEYIITLTAKDLDFVQKFREEINKALKRPPKGRVVPVPMSRYRKDGYIRSDQHRYRVYSKAVYNYLKLPLDKHKEVIEKFPAAFIQGFADSEGHVHRTRGYINLSNDDADILRYIQALLEKVGLHSRVAPYYEKKRAKMTYHLLITSVPSIQNFARTINFNIERKSRRLEKWGVA